MWWVLIKSGEKIHFSVTTLFKYKTTFEVADPPARASHHVMAMGGTVPYFIDLGNREMKSDWYKFRLRTFLKIKWMTHHCTKLKLRSQSKLLAKKYMAALRAVLKPMAYQWSWGSCRQMSGRKMSRSDPIRRETYIDLMTSIFDFSWPIKMLLLQNCTEMSFLAIFIFILSNLKRTDR